MSKKNLIFVMVMIVIIIVLLKKNKNIEEVNSTALEIAENIVIDQNTQEENTEFMVQEYSVKTDGDIYINTSEILNAGRRNGDIMVFGVNIQGPTFGNNVTFSAIIKNMSKEPINNLPIKLKFVDNLGHEAGTIETSIIDMSANEERQLKLENLAYIYLNAYDFSIEY